MDFKTIYRTKAKQYDLLVSREDYQGNILRALMEIRLLANLEVIELGAGTGRLTRLLAPTSGRYLATDISTHMLAMAQKRQGNNRYQLAAAENDHLPVVSNSADLVIAGWSIGHLTGWYPESWSSRVDNVVREMMRVVRPNGTIIILETLGTGQKSPQPPNETLAEYYKQLETVHGFNNRWIRTDYRFESVSEAEILTRFFFGPQLADRIVRDKIVLLPECTGIWYCVKYE